MRVFLPAWFALLIGFMDRTGFAAEQPPADSKRYVMASNFATDILGEADHRQGTWGKFGDSWHDVIFHPPANKRVHILRVYGDFVAWPVGKAPEGTALGTLTALSRSGPLDVKRVAEPADPATFFYIQLPTGQKPERAAFDTDVSDGGWLSGDNVLHVKMSTWLNNTGLAAHMEVTFTMVFRFEDAPAPESK